MDFWILEVPGSPERGTRRFSQVWVCCAEGTGPLAEGGGSGCGEGPAWLPSHSEERIVTITMDFELRAASWDRGAGSVDGQTDGFFPSVGQSGVPGDSLNQYNWSQ